MPKDPLKEALSTVHHLRLQGLSEANLANLGHLIKHSEGVVVARAAALAKDWNATALSKDLEEAFFRLRDKGITRDPQCWGKHAVINALHELAWQDNRVFVEGCKTIQLEPVYGGKQDSAIAVRKAAIQALVQLPTVNTSTVATALADLLADESAQVRAEAARACVYCQPGLVHPLLRLKIRLGDGESRVQGVCFDSLLVVAPDGESIALILEYANTKASTKSRGTSHDVLQAEAIASLASSSFPEAVTALTVLYSSLKDRQVRRVAITTLGTSPTNEAFRFLCQLVQGASSSEAKWALEALRPKLDSEANRNLIKSHIITRNDPDVLDLYASLLP